MKLDELRNLIITASQAYYGNEETILSDAEFDALMDELREKCPDDPLLNKISHGYEVSLDNSGKKIAHKYKTVGSLGKINAETCHEYFNRKENCRKIITSKLDGGSVVIYYDQHGKLEYAATRGDGNIGIDCTSKIIKIGVPTQIVTNTNVAVRGEVIMPIATFNEYYPDASSPRNTAMGLMNKIDPTDEEMWRLVFVAYAAYTDPQKDSEGLQPHGQPKSGILNWLEANGFFTPSRDVITNGPAILKDQYLRSFLESKKGCLDPNWPSDGIVITNEYDLDDEIAYKFPPEEAETKVLFMQWITSRFGNVIPVIHFRPVRLSGAVLTKCSGFNAKWIKQNNLAVGSKVIVHRAGEVIPYIKNVVASSDKPFAPSFCPVCQTPLKWKGVHLNCPNPGCSAKTIPGILLWLSTIAPVDGLGENILVPLVNWMQWTSIKDIYLTEHETFQRYFTETAVTENAKKLINEMLDKLFMTPTNPIDFFVGFGLPAVGSSTAKKVVAEIGLDEYFEDPCRAQARLMGMKRITTPAIVALQTHYREMFDIYQRIVFGQAGFAVFAKKEKIAITGKLSKSRKALALEFEGFGFTVVDAVSKDVKYLITDNPESGSSKNATAKRLGVQILSEDKFRELLNK